MINILEFIRKRANFAKRTPLGCVKFILDPIVVLASFVLLVALSVEILSGRDGHFTSWYLVMQLIVSILFIFDFFVMMGLAESRLNYFFRHLFILIISVPYLSIMPDNGVALGHESELAIGLLPQLRAFVALYVVLRWIMRERSIKRLFFAYVTSVIAFTYIAALIFYDCEFGLNEPLVSFGDALWWAATGLATLGNPFLPITTTGKVLSALLPLFGMMLLPISTSYLIAIYKRR